MVQNRQEVQKLVNAARSDEHFTLGQLGPILANLKDAQSLLEQLRYDVNLGRLRVGLIAWHFVGNCPCALAGPFESFCPNVSSVSMFGKVLGVPLIPTTKLISNNMGLENGGTAVKGNSPS